MEKLVDLAGEAAATVRARPVRALLAGAATTVSVAVFVVNIAMAATVRAQVGARFDAVANREVVVRLNPDDLALGRADVAGFPDDFATRVLELDGANAVGRVFEVGAASNSVAADRTSAARQFSVLGVTEGTFEVRHVRIQRGTRLAEAHEHQRVAVIGKGVAAALGIAGLTPSRFVFLDGEPFTVVGVVDSVSRNPETGVSVLIPASTAIDIWGEPAPQTDTLQIEVRPGAARVVADQVKVALRPTHPDQFGVIAPPDPRTVRQRVSADLTSLLTGVAAVTLLAGLLGIANSTLTSVLERVPEIGMRRAMGASRSHILMLIALESIAIGLIGATIGTSLGVVVTAIIAGVKEWTVVVPPALALSPLIGIAAGAVAGFFPARRASRIEPLAALRR